MRAFSVRKKFIGGFEKQSIGWPFLPGFPIVGPSKSTFSQQRRKYLVEGGDREVEDGISSSKSAKRKEYENIFGKGIKEMCGIEDSW